MKKLAIILAVGLPAALAVLSVIRFFSNHEARFLLSAFILGVCSLLGKIFLKAVFGDAPKPKDRAELTGDM